MHKAECVTSAVAGPREKLVEGAQSRPDLGTNESRCKDLISKLMEWELILSVAAGIVTSLPCVKPIRFKRCLCRFTHCRPYSISPRSPPLNIINYYLKNERI